MDGFEGKTAGGRYEYPFAQTPGPGAVIEVASGVRWVRMPLPFSLKWINLWLIEDGDGWTVVDTGIPNSETKALWRAIFDTVLDGRPVRRIIITHMHPDHIGLAGWMSRKFQCELWMTRLEYVTCRMLIADTGREAPEAGVMFYRAAGWAQEDIDRYIDRFGGFGRSVTQLPDAFRRISDGDVIEIGGRPWHVVTGCGHSPDHACLFAPDINVFISGDQILPRISSNVSVFPTEPDADPLTDWLGSCAKLKAAIPADVLVLPAHNEPFRGAHRRLDALIQGHEAALSRMLERLAEPRRVVDLFGALFARAIGPDTLGMATGEAIAHLNCLQRRGLVRAERDGDVLLYRRAS
jgi:glyoxylase-like metal-dependent hydrolase (beta-lactamase superfamily II)